MKVNVKTVPVKGETSSQEIDVEASVSVGDVLRAANVNQSKMKVTIDGKVVSDSDIVPEGATVTLTEKPSGS